MEPHRSNRPGPLTQLWVECSLNGKTVLEYVDPQTMRVRLPLLY